MIKSSQSHQVRAKNASSLLSQSKRVETILFSLLLLCIPVQLGKHFWPDFSIIQGIRVDYLSPTIYLTDILILLLVCVFTLRLAARFKGDTTIRSILTFKKIITSPLFIFFLAIFYLLINIVLSKNFLNGAYQLIKFLEISFVVFYIASIIKERQQVIQVFILLSVGVIFSSILSIMQFINQGSLGGMFYFFGERTFTSFTPGIANASLDGQLLLRPYATFSHPNVLAGFLLCVLVPILLLFPTLTSKWNKSFFVGTILLGTAGLLLTMSRVAITIWFGVLFIGLVYLIIKASRIRKINFLTLCMFTVLILLGASTFFLSPLGSRFIQTNFAEESFVQRKDLIDISLEMIKQHPFTGIGLGGFLPTLSKIHQPLSPMQYFQPVHNIFLLVLVEVGIIGFTLFVLFLAMTYHRLSNALKKDILSRALVITFSTILVLGLFDHYFLTVQQGQLVFAVILGLCWNKIYREQFHSFPE